MFLTFLVFLLIVTSVAVFFAYRSATLSDHNLKDRHTQIRQSHHRMQNTLQIISSLFNHDQQAGADKQDTKNSHKHFQNQIAALGALYRNLDDQSGNIDFSNFLRNFSLQSEAKATIDEQLLLNEEVAIPLGLLLNEFINARSNKPATDNNTVRIELIPTQDYITMCIYGSRYDAEVLENSNSEDLAGAQLIRDLAEQIDATIDHCLEDPEDPAWSIVLKRESLATQGLTHEQSSSDPINGIKKFFSGQKTELNLDSDSVGIA